MSDNITLPRELAEKALEALEHFKLVFGGYSEEVKALRTALAAEQQKPEPVAVFDEQMGHPVLLPGSPMLKDKQPLYAAPPAPPATHPGYVIGSHWLETAYSRICAGEAEADVLRDCGWERVDDAEALRRDAERYRWLRERAWFQFEFDGRYGDSGETVQELDAAIDAAMGDKR